MAFFNVSKYVSKFQLSLTLETYLETFWLTFSRHLLMDFFKMSPNMSEKSLQTKMYRHFGDKHVYSVQ